MVTLLIVIGEARAAAGRREQMVDAVSTVAMATRHDDGCQLYGFYADVTNPETILSVELWRDQASLDAHMAHEHTKQFLAAVPGLVADEPTMRLFQARPMQEDGQ